MGSVVSRWHQSLPWSWANESPVRGHPSPRGTVGWVAEERATLRKSVVWDTFQTQVMTNFHFESLSSSLYPMTTLGCLTGCPQTGVSVMVWWRWVIFLCRKRSYYFIREGQANETGSANGQKPGERMTLESPFYSILLLWGHHSLQSWGDLRHRGFHSSSLFALCYGWHTKTHLILFLQLLMNLPLHLKPFCRTSIGRLESEQKHSLFS